MDQIGIFQAFFLALVQGVTEFLPVSSSGNVILFQQLFGITGGQLTFTIVVHVASALAIIFFFFDRLKKASQQLWLPIFVGTIPAIFVALFFREIVLDMFSNSKLVSIALFVTGFVNLGIQHVLSKRNEQQPKQAQLEQDEESKLSKKTDTNTDEYAVSLRQSFLIGIAQAMAITPGISRSGSTVFAGLLTGLSRKNAFEFSFLLAIPAIAGATILQVVSEFNNTTIGISEFLSLPYFVGFIGSFVASYGSLWLLKYMMERAQFWWFALYCFGMGSLGLFFI
jgi:undecaprenyl-diphosphatase